MYEVSLGYVPLRMALVASRIVTREMIPHVVQAAFADLAAHVDSGGACGLEETLIMFPRDLAEPGEHEIRIAVTIADGVPGDGIDLEELPACQVVKTTHVGPYAETYKGWEAVEEWMDEHDLEPASEWYWEVYRNQPSQPDESDAITELQVPLP